MKPGHLKNDKGELIFVGNYTEAIRDAYMYYRVERYLIDHPAKTRKQAGAAARQAWRRKAAQSMTIDK